MLGCLRMAAGDAASLRAAVSALYGGAGQQLSSANAWLNAFSKTPEAWGACIELLTPSERPEVTFFCANLLLSKVRSEWHKLSADQATSMGTVIRYVFTQLMEAVSWLGQAGRWLLELWANCSSLSHGQAGRDSIIQCMGLHQTHTLS